MNRRYHFAIPLILLVSLILAIPTFASLPATISYQGYLTTSGGVPASGTVSMVFSLYSSNPARNNPVWQESKSITPVNGMYNAQLGSTTPITAPFDVPYYLGLKVGSDPEMALQPLASTGYAFRARTADSVPGSAIADGSITGPKLAAGSVTSDKIAAGAIASFTQLTDGVVTDSKITGPVGGAKLAGLSVTGDKIADGAVTNAKIAGPIDISKRPMAVYPLLFPGYSSTVIAPSSPDFTFAGPTVTVTTPYTQKIIGSAVAGFYVDSQATVYYGLCYRAQGTQTLYNFSPYPPYVLVPAVGGAYSISSAVDLAPGTWDIGYCVRGSVNITLLSVNGWVMTTN